MDSTPLDTPRPPWAFLTARWTHLLLATYVVPPELLASHLPPGLDLDLHDGQAFASLVCFDFLDTRVFGIPWPGFRNFSEMNLRFYVRQGADRGVVFVREFVPKRFVAWMARTLYNEPYLAAPMTSTVIDEREHVRVEHRLTLHGRTYTMRAVADKPAHVPEPNTEEAFFKEHHWGYGTTRRGRTRRYRVWHPVWAVYPIREAHVDLDWAAVYGPEWAAMQGVRPTSTMLAVGSAIAVYPNRSPTPLRLEPKGAVGPEATVTYDGPLAKAASASAVATGLVASMGPSQVKPFADEVRS
jgi:uncharacterized protein YqjF (DUF2071 family)